MVNRCKKISESPSKFHLDSLDQATDQNLSCLCYVFSLPFVISFPLKLTGKTGVIFLAFIRRPKVSAKRAWRARDARWKSSKKYALFVSRPSRHACLVLHVRLVVAFAGLKNANRLFCTLPELPPDNHSGGAVFKSCDNSYS